jgi:hypothetical protein
MLGRAGVLAQAQEPGGTPEKAQAQAGIGLPGEDMPAQLRAVGIAYVPAWATVNPAWAFIFRPERSFTRPALQYAGPVCCFPAFQYPACIIEHI